MTAQLPASSRNLWGCRCRHVVRCQNGGGFERDLRLSRPLQEESTVRNKLFHLQLNTYPSATVVKFWNHTCLIHLGTRWRRWIRELRHSGCELKLAIFSEIELLHIARFGQ